MILHNIIIQILHFTFLRQEPVREKKITNADEPAASPNYFSSESDALFIHEVDNENLIKSGREWYQPVSAFRRNHR